MWMILIGFKRDLIRRDLPIALPARRRRAIVRIGSRRACAIAGDDPMTTTTRRRSDMARPEKRGDRWRARIWNPFTQKYDTVPNEDDTRYTTFPTETAADIAQRAALTKLLKAYEDAGVDPVVPERSVCPFRMVAEQWLPLIDGRAQTRRNRADTVRLLVKRFGTTDINAIDEDDVRQYMRDLEEAGLAPNTIQLRLVVMRMIVDYAHRKGYLAADKDPVQGIKYKPYRLKEPGTLKNPGFETLVGAAEWWFRPALYLGYDHGLRAGEVAGLTWKRLELDGETPRMLVKDVVEKDGTLRPLTKGRKDKWYKLKPRTAEALRELRSRRPQDGPDDRVIRNPRGTVMVPGYVADNMRATWEASELPGQRLTFHCLRHSFITNMAEAGVPFHRIVELARHSDPKTTMAYIKALDDSTEDDAMDKVQAMFDKQKQEANGIADVLALPAQISPQQVAALQALLSTFTQQAA
jgi:integrase